MILLVRGKYEIRVAINFNPLIPQVAANFILLSNLKLRLTHEASIIDDNRYTSLVCKAESNHYNWLLLIEAPLQF